MLEFPDLSIILLVDQLTDWEFISQYPTRPEFKKEGADISEVARVERGRMRRLPAMARMDIR